MAEKLNPTGNGMNDAQTPAIIGASIQIKGEVTGSEDLLVLGSVEGSVTLKDNVVIVGDCANVTANITAREIQVDGSVNGDLKAKDKVVIRSTGFVRGNIASPCLSLEEGARLRGSIDTEPSADEMVSVTVEETRSRPSAATWNTRPHPATTARDDDALEGTEALAAKKKAAAPRLNGKNEMTPQ